MWYDVDLERLPPLLMCLGGSSHQRYGAVDPTLHWTSSAAGVVVQYVDMLGGGRLRSCTHRAASSTVPVLSFVCVSLRVVLLTSLELVFGSIVVCPSTTLTI